MTPGESRVVADGDTVRSISLEEGVEVWQVLDTRGKVLQLPGMLAARRPLVPGERVRLTEKDLVELAEDGSLDFSDEEEVASSEPYGEDLALPEPHPRFVQHFSAELYTDSGDEFSPFGSDEGADAFVAIETLPRWALSRPLIESLRLVYGPGVDADLARTGLEDTRETDPLLIGGAFAVLYLTGTLDAPGLEIAEASVRRQIERYGLHDILRRIRDDLHTFAQAR